MNNMIVKSVDLMGDSIMAAKDSEGNIWAGVSYFCNALGMNKKQKDWQTEKVQSDKILSKGAGKFGAGVFDPNNDTIALRIDFVPLWLTKISVTKQMEKNHPELADKLLQYQLKAKDILAEAFMPKQNTMPQTTDGKIQLLAQGYTEMSERMTGIEERMDSVENELPLLPIDADRISDSARRRGAEVLGGKTSNAYKSKSLRQNVFASIYGNLKYNFGITGTYKKLRRSQTDKAVEIIQNYQPPLYLQEKIDAENKLM